MQTRFTYTALCTLLAAAMFLCSQSGAVPQATERRHLSFPQQSLGALSLVRITDYMVSNSDIKKVGIAQGERDITLPPGYGLMLDLSVNVARNPDLLKLTPKSGIDILRLTFVSFDDAEDDICDRAVANVRFVPSITHLLLDRSESGDEGLSQLGSLKNLRYLSAFGASIKGTGFKDLATCKELRYICLDWNPVDSEAIIYLSKLPHLNYVLLNSAQLKPAAIKGLGQCKELITLDIGGNRDIDDTCVQDLMKLTNLHSLRIANTKISVKGISQLAKLPKLKHLFVLESQCSPEQAEELNKKTHNVAVAGHVPISEVQKQKAEQILRQKHIDATEWFSPLH